VGVKLALQHQQLVKRHSRQRLTNGRPHQHPTPTLWCLHDATFAVGASIDVAARDAFASAGRDGAWGAGRALILAGLALGRDLVGLAGHTHAVALGGHGVVGCTLCFDDKGIRRWRERVEGGAVRRKRRGGGGRGGVNQQAVIQVVGS